MRQSMITFILTLILVPTSCGQTKTQISVEGGNPPTFRVSGIGTIVDLRIYGPKQRAGDGPEVYTVWELTPIDTSGKADLDTLSEIGSIKYGSIPKGYKQDYPENNNPAPKLEEDTPYILFIMTNDAPWGQKSFEIHDGKVIVSKRKSDPLTSMKN